MSLLALVIEMLKRSPWVYIPTLYFAEGLPYAVVMMMSSIYFKDLGVDNKVIGLTSALHLPWMFKFAWAPLIDFYGEKKRWIVVAQLVLAIGFGLFGTTALSADPVQTGIVWLLIMAFASATHDASIDGYYLEVLDKNQQALFVGVRNTAYRVSMIFATGAMVYYVGVLSKEIDKPHAWFRCFEIIAGIMFLLFLLHAAYIPGRNRPRKDSELVDGKVIPASEEVREKVTGKEFLKAIFSYFKQPGIVAIVCYILTFRLGEAMVVKMITPFLQDPLNKGGMGLSLEQVGTIYGTVGIAFLLLGGIVGGFLVSKFGLKKMFWPATLVMNITILLYWSLAFYRPSAMEYVFAVNSVEQFGYGFGMAAYTVFLLYTVSDKYKAAHYAVATALMALSLVIPGMASGFIHEKLGYANFFLLSFVLSIPGMISIFFLPIWSKDDKPEDKDQSKDADSESGSNSNSNSTSNSSS